MEDPRGILRGACQVCLCPGYVKPEGGMKCGSCAHPPGKHSSLTAASSRGDTSTSVKHPSIGGDSSTPVKHSPQPHNGGDSSTPVKHSPQPLNGGDSSTPVKHSSIGGDSSTTVKHSPQPHNGGDSSTPVKYSSIGGDSSTPVKHSPQPHNGGDSSTPVKHSSQPHNGGDLSVSVQDLPVLPRRRGRYISVIPTKSIGIGLSKNSKSPRRLRGATTSSFCPPVNDVDEDLIESIEQTTIRSRLIKPPSDSDSRLLKPLSSPKQAWAAAESSPSTRRKTVQDTSPSSRILQQWRADSSSSETAIEVPEELLCVGCHKKKKFQKKDGNYFDYCGKSCRDYYRGRGGKGSDGVSASEVSICSSSDTRCITLFQSKWAPQKGACPRVDYVFTITNSHLEHQFQYFKRTVKVLGTEEHFHGTSLKCNLARSSSLCLDRSCGVCSISRYGFNLGLIGTNVSFQRFGTGLYLAPNSSKCHDYTQGSPDSGHRALILCEVCPGRKHKLQKNNKALTGPPAGYDCVWGEVGIHLNYPEIVFYNSQPVLPKYIILYKLNDIQKLVH